MGNMAPGRRDVFDDDTLGSLGYEIHFERAAGIDRLVALLCDNSVSTQPLFYIACGSISW